MGCMGRLPSSFSLSPDIRPVDLAYLAGLIDGDGSFTYKHGRGYRYWCLIVSNHNTDVMRWLTTTFGGKAYVARQRAKMTQPGNWWEVRRIVDLEWLVRNMMPYLVVKRAVALICLTELRRRIKVAGLQPRTI